MPVTLDGGLEGNGFGYGKRVVDVMHVNDENYDYDEFDDGDSLTESYPV